MYTVCCVVPEHVSSIFVNTKLTVGDTSHESTAVAVAAHASGSGLASHETVLAPVGKVNSGSVVSMVIRLATSVILFPQASVAVKIYSVVVEEPHISSESTATKVIVGVSQLSIAIPPPKLFNQSDIDVVLSMPHSTIKSAGEFIITGFILSVNVIVRDEVDEFIQLSVAVNVIITGTLHVVGNPL